MNTSPYLLTFAAVAAAASLSLGSPVAQARATATKPAQQCTADLTAFDSRLKSDGCWLHGSGYGNGYPMYGYRYAYILAQRGNQQACESVLGSARDVYTSYVVDLRSGRIPRVEVTDWRSQQIATAVAVTGADMNFRSDALVGAGVVNPQGDDLGSVDDIVMDPQTANIAYLVISRGGIFGFGKKYVPVPWEHIKAAPGNKLLVLASSKASMDGAPQVREEQSFQGAAFAAEALKLNDHWVAHVAP